MKAHVENNHNPKRRLQAGNATSSYSGAPLLLRSRCSVAESRTVI